MPTSYPASSLNQIITRLGFPDDSDRAKSALADAAGTGSSSKWHCVSRHYEDLVDNLYRARTAGNDRRF